MIKKIFFTLVLMLMTGSAFGISVITGKWKRYANGNTIALSTVENGQMKEIATSNLSGDQSFAFAFSPESEGFYVIGTNNRGAMNNYVFYLKDGDNLNFEVDKDSYKLIDQNTPENIEMERWHNFIQPLEAKSSYFRGKNSTYVDFFPLLEEKLEAVDSYKVASTTNKKFNEKFAFYTNANLMNESLTLVYTPRSAHPQAEDFPDYYSTLSVESIIQNDEILNYPYGIALLNYFNLFSARKELKDTPDYTPAIVINRDLALITDPKTRGEMLLFRANAFGSNYEVLTKMKNEYGQYLINDSQKNRLEELITEHAKNTEGQAAYNFSMKDITGKEVTMSDLKGKVVYVDVWATWCGPCKKQAPYFDALAEKYKDNANIVFLSISVDQEKDFLKWEKYVLAEKGKVPGIHLFAGKQATDLHKAYKIKGIPRFMLFDKQGKIITTEAPFPSSDEIAVALENALKK